MRIVKAVGREWFWPEEDKRLVRFIDQWKHLDQALDLAEVDPMSCGIQAGGAMGIWPFVMSKRLAEVITFEPEEENYRCLQQNLMMCPNINMVQAALGSKTGWCDLELYNPENRGTWFTVQGNRIRVVTIDSILIPSWPVGFIQLDIEGREVEALEGAAETIERWSPAIMVEENVKSERNKDFPVDTWGMASKKLESLGYQKIATLARDTVWRRK